MDPIENNTPAVNFNTSDYTTTTLQLIQFRRDSLEKGMFEYLSTYTSVPEEQIYANIENIMRDVHGVEPLYAYDAEHVLIGVPGECIVRIDRTMSEVEGPRYYNVQTSADFSSFARISQYLDNIRTVRQREEGVYDLNIRYYNYHPVQGIQARRFHMTNLDFNSTHAELYPYIDVDVLIDLYAESDESIMILQGEPGTGKTSLLKLIMREMAVRGKTDLDIAYIKDRDVLSQNSFWIMMTEQEPDLMILDDLDEELLPRTENDDNTIVNQLLSFSDGIFQSETKVLVTTNMSTSKIDPALVRPGRCFDALRIIPLQISEARDLWGGLYEMPLEKFTASFSADIERGAISQAKLVSEVMRVRAMGNAPYLRKQSISVRREYIKEQ